MNIPAISIYAALVLIPGLPLLLIWRRVLIRRASLAMSSPVTFKLPLLVTTGSSLLFFLNLLFEPTTGVHYSDRRFVMIVTAFVASLAMVVLSLVGRHPLKWLLAIASTAVAVAWLYIWAISAAV